MIKTTYTIKRTKRLSSEKHTQSKITTTKSRFEPFEVFTNNSMHQLLFSPTGLANWDRFSCKKIWWLTTSLRQHQQIPRCIIQRKSKENFSSFCYDNTSQFFSTESVTQEFRIHISLELESGKFLPKVSARTVIALITYSLSPTNSTPRYFLAASDASFSELYSRYA